MPAFDPRPSGTRRRGTAPSPRTLRVVSPGAHHRASRRVVVRRRVLAGAVVLTLAVGAVLATLGGWGSPSSTTVGASRRSEIQRPPGVAPTTAALQRRSGPFAVGDVRMTFVEPSGLPTPPIGGASGRRSLPTVVRFPVSGPPDAAPAVGANPDRVDGPYPLIVFSQGYDVPAEAYTVMLTRWASAGYVVADPTYPGTAPSIPSGLNEGDIVNHPGDLRFLVQRLEALTTTKGDLLGGLIDPREVGLAGHSDGGDVTLAVASNSCCREPFVERGGDLLRRRTRQLRRLVLLERHRSAARRARQR